MLIKFTCKHCGGRLETEGDDAGKSIVCPVCSGQVVVPGAIGPGYVIGGFRIERRLAEGGMGEVYLATQLSMERPVALKILPPAVTRDPALIEQFLREVRILAKLDHPNVVTAFEAGEDAGVHYLAMQYVEGETLAQRLKRAGPLSEPEALRVALSIAQALQHAWEKHQLLHHDVKPDNIMLDRHGEAYLMDVGISAVFREKQADGGEFVEGTPEYMSPERIQGQREPDPRSDIYSLGATLYEALTGAPPFSGKTPAETMAAQVNQPIPLLRPHKPAITENCERLVEWMLAKQPARRHAGWDVLIADLQRVGQAHRGRQGPAGPPRGRAAPSQVDLRRARGRGGGRLCPDRSGSVCRAAHGPPGGGPAGRTGRRRVGLEYGARPGARIRAAASG
jgi:eukaryotic-like serine/threonine-protein kinase